jgi:hypothetical protein
MNATTRVLLVLLSTIGFGQSLAAASEQPAWWEQETRMDHGFLSFQNKPWWAKAQAMKSGERIYLDLNKDGIRDTIIFKEGTEIVEVLDDGLHFGMNTTMGDYIDSCWVMDYDADGLVDRIIDYIDDDENGFPDEVEVRYFVDGNLIWSWHYEVLDKKWPTWTGWHYNWNQIKRKGGMIPAGDHTEIFALIGQGNSIYAINKYDKEHDRYIPFSECPFAFFDFDNDGRSEAVIRVSAAPVSTYREGRHSGSYEYANDYRNMWGPFQSEMLAMGNLNVRYSFNIKNSDTERQPLNYDMGFTLVGKVPYDYPEMEQFKAKRRHPKTFIHIKHSNALAMANSYPALETGFSWDEWGDSALGAGSRPVWEGVFWIWERHILFNTGGPTRKWNIRREYDGKPSRERKLYYSDVDKRIHLLNASAGWTEVGHVFGTEKIAEVRTFDTDGDGYFDRWEYDLDNDGRPERTTTVRDARARPVSLSYQELNRLFTKEVLPAAILENERLIAEFKRFVKLDDHRAIQLEEMAFKTNRPERRRYLLDLVREYYYQAFRKRALDISNSHPMAVSAREGRQGSITEGFASEAWWEFSKDLSMLDQSYGSGDYERVASYLKAHAPLLQ